MSGEESTPNHTPSPDQAVRVTVTLPQGQLDLSVPLGDPLISTLGALFLAGLEMYAKHKGLGKPSRPGLSMPAGPIPNLRG
jgi:hypothetical protein